MIKPLPTSSKLKICAEQVIVDITQAVKQLIDNAIDASPTTITILMQEYGGQKLEVFDDGHGISRQDLLNIAIKGCTSKLNTLDDLASVRTLGFRGEALNSLSQLSQMQIESSRSAEGPGYHIDLQTREIKEGSFKKGTKVIVKNLFYNTPVRQKDLQAKGSHFHLKAMELIKQYALSYLNIVFKVISTFNNKKGFTWMSGRVPDLSPTSWKMRIEVVLDSKHASVLEYRQGKYFQGYFSKYMASGTAKSFLTKTYAYMFLNRRPIDLIAKLGKTLEKQYQHYNESTKYVCIVNLKVDPQNIDINKTADKREVYLKQEAKIIEQIVKTVEELLESKKSTVASYPVQSQLIGANGRASTQILEKKTGASQSSIADQVEDVVSQKRQTKHVRKPIVDYRPSSYNTNMVDKQVQQKKYQKIRNELNMRQSIRKRQAQEAQQKVAESSGHKNNTSLGHKCPEELARPQVQLKTGDEAVVAKFDVQDTFTRQDFQKVQIRGQYNLSFILSSIGNQFYLFDQHASSERFNYQKILAEGMSVMEWRKRFEVTATQYENAEAYQAILQKFGYKFTIQEETADETEPSQANRYFINTNECPTFLGKVFDHNMFRTLLSDLGSGDCNKIEQHPIVVKSAATKACRMSVMVGDKLNKQEMASLVRNLERMNCPWTCPHGRPVVFKLQNLPSLKNKTRYQPGYSL